MVLKLLVGVSTSPLCGRHSHVGSWLITTESCFCVSNVVCSPSANRNHYLMDRYAQSYSRRFRFIKQKSFPFMESPHSSLFYLLIYLFIFCNTRHYIGTSVGTNHLYLIPFRLEKKKSDLYIIKSRYFFLITSCFSLLLLMCHFSDKRNSELSGYYLIGINRGK